MLRGTADFPGGHPCIVCNNSMHYTDPCHHLLDIVDNRTVKERLEEVLEQSVDNTTTQWLCELCYSNLRRIEEYYTLLTSFKKQYTQNAITRGELAQGQQDPGGTGRGDGAANSSSKNYPNVLGAVKFGEDFLQTLGADKMATIPGKVAASLGPAQSLQTKSQAIVADTAQNVDGGNSEGAGEEEEDGENNGDEDGGDLLGDDFLEDDEVGEEMLNEDVIHEEEEEEEEEERDQDRQKAKSNSKERLKTGSKSPNKTVLDEKHAACSSGSVSPESSNESFTLEKPRRKPRSSKRRKNKIATNFSKSKKGSKIDFTKKSFDVEKGRQKQTCEICCKVYYQKARMVKHMESHSKEALNETSGELECITCAKAFDSNHEWQTHMKEKHQDTDKPYSCLQCNRAFKRYQTLAEHMKTHSNERPYVCSCGKSFAHANGLRTHKNSLKHSGEKRMVCPKCGKMFKTNHSLMVHMDIGHDTEGPYEFVCDVCNVGFHYKGTLHQHKKKHTTGKHFLCTICGMSFTQKQSLLRHNLIHTEEKPHCCSYCGKKFRHEVTLKGHILMHTGKYKHRCQVCNKGFFRKVDLTRHDVTHSNDRPPAAFKRSSSNSNSRNAMATFQDDSREDQTGASGSHLSNPNAIISSTPSIPPPPPPPAPLLPPHPSSALSTHPGSWGVFPESFYQI